MGVVRLAFGVAFVAALTTSVLAAAQVKLVSSSPAAGSIVNGRNDIGLNFAAKLDPSAKATLVITDKPGAQMSAPMTITAAKSVLGADGKTLIVRLTKPLSAGTYRISWHAGSNGSQTTGHFSFQVK